MLPAISSGVSICVFTASPSYKSLIYRFFFMPITYRGTDYLVHTLDTCSFFSNTNSSLMYIGMYCSSVFMAKILAWRLLSFYIISLSILVWFSAFPRCNWIGTWTFITMIFWGCIMICILFDGSLFVIKFKSLKEWFRSIGCFFFDLFHSFTFLFFKVWEISVASVSAFDIILYWLAVENSPTSVIWVGPW